MSTAAPTSSPERPHDHDRAASPSSTPARRASSSRSTKPGATARCCSADRSRASASRRVCRRPTPRATVVAERTLARRRPRPSRRHRRDPDARPRAAGRPAGAGLRPSRRPWRHGIRRAGARSMPTSWPRSPSWCRWRRCTSRTISRRSRRSPRPAPHLPQVACFDTAFHRSQPPLAQAFALPRELTDGRRAPLRLPRPVLRLHRDAAAARSRPALARSRLIIAHLGNGASLCAVQDGKSVASTMGFTAVDGLMMGTRYGRARSRRAALPDAGARAGRQRPSRTCSTAGPACSASPASPRTCAPCASPRRPRRPRRSPCSSTASCARSARWRPRWAASTASSSPPASARTMRRRAPRSPPAAAGSGLKLDAARNAAGDGPHQRGRRRGLRLGRADRRGADDRPLHQPDAGPLIAPGTAVTDGEAS